MTNVTALELLDYILLAGIAAVFLAIGFYFACFEGKQRTTREYFKGDGNMNWIPVVMSMMATFMSSTTMLGIPSEVYYYGFNYLWIILGTFIGAPISMYGFLPVFHKMECSSIFEYIERRFNRALRLSCSFLFIITMVVFTSFVTYTPSLALSQITGLRIWTSVLSTTVVATIYTSIVHYTVCGSDFFLIKTIVIHRVGTNWEHGTNFYTSKEKLHTGGIKAVVWTDCLQLLVFVVATLATIIKSCIDLGGVFYVFQKNIEGHRLEMLSFSLDPRIRFTFWGLLAHSVLRCLTLYGANQLSLQRYLCCRNKKTAQRAIWISLVSSGLITTIFSLIGLILYAMYWNCDPLASQQIQKHDQLFPLFVMQTMSSIPGMLGLFVAGLFCAALSSISSALNSLAAITLEDHVKPKWKSLSDVKAALISKVIAVAFGIFSLLIIAVIMNIGSVVQALQYLIGGSAGATLGLFVLGLMNPWANSKGSLIGVVCGLVMGWWISFGNKIHRPPPNSLLPISTANCSDIFGDWTPRPKSLYSGTDILEVYKISYLWILPIAFTVTVIIGSVSSLVIAKMDKGSNKTFNIALLSPFVHSVMKKYFSKKYKEVEQKYKSDFSMELTNKTKRKNVEKLTSIDDSEALMIKNDPVLTTDVHSIVA